MGTVTGSNAPLTRATGAQTPSELSGLEVEVIYGTTNRGTFYQLLLIPTDITVDTTSLNFTLVGGSSGIAHYSSETTYGSGDVVVANDGTGEYGLYVSQVGENLNEPPHTSSSWWGYGFSQQQLYNLLANLETNLNFNNNSIFNIPAIGDDADNAILGFPGIMGTPVNFLQIQGGATGNSPTIRVTGTDSSVGMDFWVFGSGGAFQYSSTSYGLLMKVQPWGISINTHVYSHDVDNTYDLGYLNGTTGEESTRRWRWGNFATGVNTPTIGQNPANQHPLPTGETSPIVSMLTLPPGHVTYIKPVAAGTALISGLADNGIAGPGAQPGCPRTVVIQYGEGWQRDGAGAVLLGVQYQNGSTGSYAFALAPPTNPVVNGDSSGYWNLSGGNNVFDITVSGTELIYSIASSPSFIIGANTSFGTVTSGHQIEFNVSIDGELGPSSQNVTVTFTTESSESDYLSTLNTQSSGVFEAVDYAGHLRIISTMQGSNANISVVSGDADVLAMIGVTVSQSGTNPGPNDVGSISQVSNAELPGVFNTHFGTIASMGLTPFTSIPYIRANNNTDTMTVAGTAATILGFSSTPVDGDPAQNVESVEAFSRIGNASIFYHGSGAVSCNIVVGAGFGVPCPQGMGAQVSAASADGEDTTITQSSSNIDNGIVYPSITPDGSKSFEFSYTIVNPP